MSNLHTDHPYLYRRVKLKSIVHIAMGLTLLLIPTQATSISHIPVISFLGLSTIGIMYVILGIIIAVGLFKPNHSYRTARIGMNMAAYFNLFVFILLLSVFLRSKTTAFFIIMYGYFTYNLFYVMKDPGWKAIQIVKQIVKDLPSAKVSIGK